MTSNNRKTMKNLFKVIAFSFVMLLGMGTMNAQGLKQDQDRPEVIAKQRTSELSQALDLNGDQQRAVFRALVSKESNYKKHINGKSASDAAVIANKKKFDDVLNTAMKKTLTDAQYKKWLTLREQ